MLNNYCRAFTLVFVTSVLSGSLVHSHELPRFGILPELGREWQLQEANTDEITPETNPFRWLVFRNSETGDLLSFATFPRNISSTPLDRHTDTALEIFPDGLAVWDHNTTRMTLEAITISTRERRLSIRRRVPVLEYSFISESKSRPNLMANGRAWFESDYIIFVQHTSALPIAPSVVDGVANACARLSDAARAISHKEGGSPGTPATGPASDG
ncbi:hypothetical protein Poly51_64000 [Rubripirellula tenax]|uniref:Uncharacterized protein n=1 Tax=Rubripirellula tenax TaxID=2528015 RepID=A0A5C6DSR4_9BACT|nr:hypothetical protein [Rubripirellula tenax]TWU40383.1 hypothetical protein Poly51_64000 [Rubripirellula tenax]